MRSLLFVNSLLIIGFLGVIAGTVFMVGWNGYNDNASHSIFYTAFNEWPPAHSQGSIERLDRINCGLLLTCNHQDLFDTG